MFLEYLSETCEVERLVVLQQDETQVELAECQFDVIQWLIDDWFACTVSFVPASQQCCWYNGTTSQTVWWCCNHIYWRAQVWLQRSKLACSLRNLLCISHNTVNVQPQPIITITNKTFSPISWHDMHASLQFRPPCSFKIMYTCWYLLMRTGLLH